MMLTGRESLVRLVGKRRRFLPNRQFLISGTVQSCLNLCTDKNGRIVSTESMEGGSSSEVGEDGKILGGDMSNSDWVTCPVCCNKVLGGDYAINSHLDVCLSRGTGRGRGTKRKLTQPTLLQLNFCAKSSKLQTHSSDSNPLEVNVIQNCPADSLVHYTNSELPNFDTTFEENDYLPNSKMLTQSTRLEVDVIPSCPADSIVQYTHSELPRFDSTIEEYHNNWCELPNSNLECTSHSTKDPVGDDRISFPETEVPTICNMDDICGVILQTFIVGRRFSDVKEVNLGAIISFQRDPLNVKDPNAIKVLLSDSECGEVLGFLPRELAQYLSPLIDKFCLSFEGRVSSVPKHSLHVVPIQILCERSMSFAEIEHDDIEYFRCLWRNVLHAVDSAKNYPPNMTKYQRNFCLLIQEVLRSNPHLLMDDEKVFLESFTSLSDDSQRLFVRLYTRKGPWFRMSTISYPEVMDSQQAVRGLSAKGYVCTFEYANELHEDDVKGILEMLTVVELRGIWCTFKKNGNRGTRKQDLIASLLLLYEDGLCPLLTSMILDRTGTCIRISPKAESLIWRAERLFFLNGEQDLSAFLLVDLGIVKYPTYNCIISDQIFSDRSELLAYEEAIEVAQIMDQSLEENNVELVLRCIKIAESRMSNSFAEVIGSSSSGSVANFLFCSSSWIYSKVVLLGVSFIEHERRYTDAIKLLKQLLRCFYCDGRRGLWTLRLSIDLEHMGCLNESLTVAEEGLLDPWVRAGFRMALQRRVLRLGKPPRRWKTPSFSESIKRKITEVHVQGRPLNCEAGMKSRFYGEDGEQCGVEQLALQYYAGEGGGWQGTHTESGIWLTIFGLLMWDIIFSDVPNVFRTKFQTAPLDLESDSFYLTRKSLIESHLQKIHEGMAEEILITSWELHVGTACRGVNWDRHSLSELRAAVTCIGGPCLASLCRHLALDYRSWSSGMPDLLLWRFHGEDRGEAKLVEVKGPRDRLSEQQRAWLLILMDSGFNVEVCKVSPLPLST